MNTEIPRQKLPREDKDFNWKKKCIDAFYDLSHFSPVPDREHTMQEKMYDLYNGIIDEDDYTHVLKPYGKERKNFPAELHNYPVIKPYIDLLIGEKRKRPLNYSVTVENPDVSNKKTQQKRKELIREMQKQFINELEQKGISTGEGQQATKGLQKIREEFDKSYRDERALQGQDALNIIMRDCEVERKFNENWKHWLLAGEVYSRRAIVGGQLKYEKLNPLHVDHDKSPDKKFVEDGDWALVRKFSYPSDIIDEYFDVLTDEEIDQIENPQTDGTGDYLFYYNDIEESDTEEDTSGRLVEVVQVYWKSRKKIGIVDYIDRYGQPQQKQVDEDYQMTERDQNVEWYWINEVWKGTRIDEDIYVDVKPVKIQRRDMDNPSECKLPINGRRYSDENAANVSLAMMIYPYQLVYNIYKFRLENAIAKSKDVIAQLDINMIPEGWDMDKFMYYVDATGIAWTDYAKEGMQPNPHQQQVMDMSIKTIEQYVSLLEHTKREIRQTLGITPQRQGEVEQYESNQSTEHAIVQSSHMTESLFARFAEFEERDLRALLDYSKWTWKNGKSTSYVMSDNSAKVAEIDGTQHQETEYGVYISDARQEVKKLQNIKQLGQAMLQNDVQVSTVADIIESDSFSEVREKIGEAEEQMEQLRKAQRQAEEKQRQREHQREMAKIEAELDQTRMDNETDIQEAKIKADKDLQENAMERRIEEKEQELKEKEMESDERIAEMQTENQGENDGE